MKTITLYRAALPVNVNAEARIISAEFSVGPKFYTYNGDDAKVPQRIRRVTEGGYDGPVYGQNWGLTEQDAAIRAVAAEGGIAMTLEQEAQGARAREAKFRVLALSLGVSDRAVP